MIFVDTGAWFARFVPDDPNHGKMVTWFANNTEQLVTTDFCIDETLTLLSVRKRPKLAVEVGAHFFDESLSTIHYLERAQVQRAWVLFRQRAYAGWSFTDCTSKIVIADRNIRSAAAFDDHFHQFGIAILPG